MKRSLHRILLTAHLFLFPLFIAIVIADPPGPPPPGVNPGNKGGSRVGDDPSGALVGDGAGILISLGMAYGCYKIYDSLKKEI